MFTISKPNDWNILHLYEKICYLVIIKYFFIV